MSLENLMDGRAISEQVHTETASRLQSLLQKGVQPCIAFIRVGEDPASQVYVGMKEKTAARLGFRSVTKVFAENAGEAELLAEVDKFNADTTVHGILVQAPIPSHINSARVYSRVLPEKDVDGFHPVNAGKVLLGDPSAFLPCTPAGVQELLVRCGVKIPGSQVVVLGRGNIVGKPMAAILMQKGSNADATVTVCHSRTSDIAGHCRRADIIVAAMGVPRFLKADMVRPGAVVVDVGVNRIPDATTKTGSRLVGDVDFEAIQPIVSRITPNPGGVGPMTIAMLMRNTVRAAEMLNP